MSVINQDLGNTQYESKLILGNLVLGNKGEYYCKATYTDNKVVESDQVTLFVQGGCIATPFYITFYILHTESR